LIAFAAGSVGFAAFGANRFVAACADSTIAPIFAGGLATVAASGSHDYFALCASFALVTGGILVCCGLFRLGWIADLVSRPVTIGFLAGTACHIVISQLPFLLGIAPPGGSLLQGVFTIAGKLGESNPVSLLLGLNCLRRDSSRGTAQPARSRRALGHHGGDYRGLIGLS
jgi:SulP family sulfate permease